MKNGFFLLSLFIISASMCSQPVAADITTIDDFSVYNANIYTHASTGAVFNYSITDDKLYTSKDQTPGETNNSISFTSQYSLDGDFSIELDYFVDIFGVGNQLELQVFSGELIPSKRFLVSRGNGFFSTDHSYVALTKEGRTAARVHVTTDMQGTIRIDREGDIFKGYYKYGDVWKLLGQDTIDADPTVYVRLVNQNNEIGNGPANRAGFSEMRITADDYSGVDPNTDPPNPNTYVVATPIITPSGGSFLNPFSCSITCETDYAEIHYTTDGSDPTIGSPLYTEPFILSSNTVLRARAYRLGYIDSVITTAQYFITGSQEPPLKAVNPSPSNGVLDQSRDLYLGWSNGGGATSYDVYLGTDPSLSSLDYKASVTDTQYDPGTLESNTTYYWRIVSTNADGATVGDVWSFSTMNTSQPPFAAVTPVPADAAENQSLSTDIVWSDGGGADQFDIFFGTEEILSSAHYQGTQSSTFYDPGFLDPNTTYYWQIVARNSFGSIAGPVWSFSTNDGSLLPNKAVEPTPEDTSIHQSVETDLSWSDGGGALQYDVYIGTSQNLSSLDYKVTQTSTTYDPGILESNTTYYWRVFSRNANGSTVGDVWNFTTEGGVLPQQPRNPMPTNLASEQETPVTLTWEDGGGARSFDVYLGTNDTFDSGDYQGTTTETNFGPLDLEGGTTYYWRIFSENDAGLTVGEVWSFSTDGLGLPLKAINPTPVNATTDIDLNQTLTWEDGGGATYYDVYIGESVILSTSDYQGTVSETSFRPTSLTPDTDCYWQIVSFNDAGGTEGDVWRFETQPVSGPLQAPEFIPLGARVSGVDIELEWTNEAASGATYYELSHAVSSEPASLQFDGEDDYLSIPDSNDFDFVGSASDDKTIDFWIKINDLQSVQQVMLQGEDGSNYWVIQLLNGNLRFLASKTGSDFFVHVGWGGSINDHEWHHVALCKVANQYGMYIDGQQVSYATSNVTALYNAEIRLGTTYDNTNYFNGNMDEIRFTNDNAFHAAPSASRTDSFDMPTMTHEVHEHTLLLLHCDSSDLPDASQGAHSVLSHNGLAITRESWNDNATQNEVYTTTDTYYTYQAQSDGVYSFRVRSFTDDHMASAYSEVTEITVDSIPPSAPGINALPALCNENNSVISGTRSIDSHEVQLQATAMEVENVIYPTDSSWQADVVYTQDGTYSISVIAIDSAGNASIPVNATVTVDTSQPVVTLISPARDHVTAQKHISIVGNVEGLTNGDLQASVVNSSGLNVYPVSVQINNSFAFELQLSPGDNLITFRATDSAQNTTSTSITISFTNDEPLILLPIGHKVIGSDETLQFEVRIESQNDIDPELYWLNATGLPGMGSSNPANFNAETGVFMWTPTQDQVGIYSDITFSVEDDDEYREEKINVIVQDYAISPSDFYKILGSVNSNLAVAADFNADNYIDLYVVNSGANIYYKNNADGTFSSIAASVGIDDRFNGVSVCTFDANGDARADLYVVNETTNTYYENNGDGTFTERTNAIGLANGEYGVAAYAHDFNGDDLIDLYLLNRESNVLYLNAGDGTFSDQTTGSQLLHPGVARSTTIADIDSDGDCDVYIVASNGNKLYLNDGDAVFSDITERAGVGEFVDDCIVRIYDIDFDGDLDIKVQNHASDIFYTNNGSEVFLRARFYKEVNDSLLDKTALFLDYDNDSDNDVLIVDENSRYVDGYGNILYQNNGDGTYSDMTVDAGIYAN